MDPAEIVIGMIDRNHVAIIFGRWATLDSPRPCALYFQVDASASGDLFGEQFGAASGSSLKPIEDRLVCLCLMAASIRRSSLNRVMLLLFPPSVARRLPRGLPNRLFRMNESEA
jgi:hypothetical protein